MKSFKTVLVDIRNVRKKLDKIIRISSQEKRNLMNRILHSIESEPVDKPVRKSNMESNDRWGKWIHHQNSQYLQIGCLNNLDYKANTNINRYYICYYINKSRLLIATALRQKPKFILPGLSQLNPTKFNTLMQEHTLGYLYVGNHMEVMVSTFTLQQH